MNLSDNKYFYEVMSKYFIILIEMNLYQYRYNTIYINEHNDDKSLGIFEAMKELSELGEKVVCINFDPNFPVHEVKNLTFIGNGCSELCSTACDFLFVFSKLPLTYPTLSSVSIAKCCSYYNPKFIVHC